MSVRDVPDFYTVLGVLPTSDDEVIRAAYRALMLKYHPDTNQTPEATARAASINEAFAILGDRQRRAAYDDQRKSKRGHNRNATPPRPAPPPKSTGDGNGPPAPTGKSDTPILTDNLRWVVVGLILLAIVGLAQLPRNETSAGSEFTEMNAADAMEGTTNDSMTAIDGVDDTSSAGNQLPEFPNYLSSSLTQSPTPLSYADIESAADSFEKELQRRGLIGARAWSQNCHNAVKTRPTWSGADKCAAFDFAARYIDNVITARGDFAESAYFKFQAENQAEQYAPLSAPPYLLTERLRRIKSAVEPAVHEAVSNGIAHRERKTVLPAVEPANNVAPVPTLTDAIANRVSG
jgi:curved DNA-binding protein CbpA